MPFAAPSICGCGKIVPAGKRCACRVAADRAHDRKRGTAHARGYDSNWQRESAAFLALNPVCNEPECTAPARVVDHVKPHKGDMRLFWDRSNWQGLCVHCHSSTKQSRERRAAQ